MELHEFHVDQVGAGAIGKSVAVAGVFPTVAGNFISAANSAGGENDGFGSENFETSTLALICQNAGNAIAVL